MWIFSTASSTFHSGGSGQEPKNILEMKTGKNLICQPLLTCFKRHSLKSESGILAECSSVVVDHHRLGFPSTVIVSIVIFDKSCCLQELQRCLQIQIGALNF